MCFLVSLVGGAIEETKENFLDSEDTAVPSATKEGVDLGNDSFEKWDGASIETCLDLVYKLTLSNTTTDKILFKVGMS